MTGERLAQPRRRPGWVTGQRARDGKPMSVNLALVCCVEQGEEQTYGPHKGSHTMWFAYPGGNGEEQYGDRLIWTEDLLRQLNEEGLG